MALASLAAKHIGEELPYKDIASALQIEAPSVEAWIIDGTMPRVMSRDRDSQTCSAIRAKVLSGKLSQPTETFFVTRATTTSYHPFNRKEQWESLEKKLVAWRTGLVNVLDVVAGAREQAFGAEGGKGAVVHGDLTPATGAVA